jgi:hypothetical protein
MPDYAVEIPLNDHRRGDKWPGIPSIGPVLINGAQPDDPLARVRMQFRHTTGARFRLDSDASADRDAPIVIDDAAAWEASVPEVASFLPRAGSWSWDMEFYETGDTAPLTLYKGTLVVHPDITE